MRTRRGLTGATIDAGALAGLSADELRAAAANPDHGEAARAAAATACGGERWRLAVPGFIAPADLARGERVFFGWGRAVRKWAGLGVFLSLLGILACAFIGMPASEEALRAAREMGLVAPSVRAGDIFWTDEENIHLSQALRGNAAFQRAALAESVGLGLGGMFGLLLMVWFFAALLRRKPARVLLLRKFNVRALSAPLERMMDQELRPYGHIVSLSDKHLKRDRFGWLTMAFMAPANPLAAAWLIIGAPLRIVYRLFDRSGAGPAIVTNARDYRNLARRLRDRLGLNLQVATTRKEAFLVRTSDAWWRLVVRLFMDSCDMIVVDLTKVTQGTAWELDMIREENVSARCVFVSLWGKGDDAQAALSRWGFDNACHFYAPDGHMLDRYRFRAAMQGALAATHGAPT